MYASIAAPLLLDVLEGYEASLLAYGQTGSGKTHSLLCVGSTEEGAAPPEDAAGLFPRIAADLFTAIAADFRSLYTVEFACCQIYNECVDDLLQPSGANLRVRAETDGGPAFVEGLQWAAVHSAASLLEAFRVARRRLVYAETVLNKHSSRSHCFVQLRVQRTERPSGAEPATMRRLIGRLVLVDLAGSERTKKSGAEGVRLREASAINTSLLALGNVVAALASRHQRHVPFRDSVLTRLLEASLGGRCRTSLLCCIAPEAEHAGESAGALEFAVRAMRIVVAPSQNVGAVLLTPAALAAALSRTAEASVLSAHGATILRLEAEAENREAELRSLEARLAGAEAEGIAAAAEVRRLRACLTQTEEERDRGAVELQQASAGRELYAAAAAAAEAQRREAQATSAAEAAEHAQEREAAQRDAAQLRAALQQEMQRADGAIQAADAAAVAAQEAAATAAAEATEAAAQHAARIAALEADTAALRASFDAAAAAAECEHAAALAAQAAALVVAAGDALLGAVCPMRKTSSKGRAIARLWRLRPSRLEWSGDLGGVAWKGLSLAGATARVEGDRELLLSLPGRAALTLHLDTDAHRAWAAALLRRLNAAAEQTMTTSTTTMTTTTA